jgi:uncharacterized protein (DUF2235 family)
MSRNIVVCCDGTNNQFGPENTSVVRLVQVLDRDPAAQILYYDPGVGTLPQPGVLTRVGKTVSRWRDLAFATGLRGKVEDAYTHLMDFWEAGDRVFLFGFSRGAYTARVLAGLLYALGLLPRGNHHLVPYVMKLFGAVRDRGSKVGDSPEEDNKDSDDQAWTYWRLCEEFRTTFARPVPGCPDDRRFRVHFLGVWDTVSSVGWVWDPVTFPYTARNPGIDIARHAVSIDERRWFFRQNLLKQAPGQDLQELWFPGVHADVGGGYPERDGGLWWTPFEWMLGEAERAGLRVDPKRLEDVRDRAKLSPRPWADPMHESLTPLWWLAEFFPKIRRGPRSSLALPRIGLGRHRYIEANALLHKSAMLRIREIDYAPPNLSESFLEKVRALSEVPETMSVEQ